MTKCKHDLDCIVQPVASIKIAFGAIFKCKKCKKLFTSEDIEDNDLIEVFVND